MHYVEWRTSATDDLAAICLEHSTQWALINTAELAITDRLQHDPITFSKHLSEGLWRIIDVPLVVYFVMDGDRIAVDAVGWIG
jgi:hypothetical protein